MNTRFSENVKVRLLGTIKCLCQRKRASSVHPRSTKSVNNEAVRRWICSSFPGFIASCNSVQSSSKYWRPSAAFKSATAKRNVFFLASAAASGLFLSSPLLLSSLDGGSFSSGASTFKCLAKYLWITTSLSSNSSASAHKPFSSSGASSPIPSSSFNSRTMARKFMHRTRCESIDPSCVIPYHNSTKKRSCASWSGAEARMLRTRMKDPYFELESSAKVGDINAILRE